MKLNTFTQNLIAIILIIIMIVFSLNVNKIEDKYQDNLIRIEDSIKYKVLRARYEICVQNSSILNNLKEIGLIDCNFIDSYKLKLEIARKLQLTDFAESIFMNSGITFVNDKIKIHDLCRNLENISFGCTYDNPDTIYIYSIQDQRIKNIENSVIAHEILHLVYERIDYDYRSSIDKLTSAVIKDSNNSHLKSALDLYQDSELAAEYHSRVATEFESLTPELEKYYSLTFKNRGSIYQFFLPLQNLFDTADKLKSESTALNLNYDDLSNKSEAIVNTSNEIDRKFNELENIRKTINPYNSAQINDFNSQVAELNKQIHQYTLDRDNLQGEIDRYNLKYDEYKKRLDDYEAIYALIDNSLTQLTKVSNVESK